MPTSKFWVDKKKNFGLGKGASTSPVNVIQKSNEYGLGFVGDVHPTLRSKAGVDSETKAKFNAMAKTVAESLSFLAPEVCLYLYPNGFEESNHWCLGDAQGKAATNKGSFRIALTGRKAGFCKDFADAESKAFDLLTAWTIAKQVSISEAIKQAKDVFGLKDDGSLKNKDKRTYAERIEAVRSKSRVPGKSGAWQTAVYNDAVVLAAMQRLRESPAALDYLLNYRGLTEKTITDFRLGLTAPFTSKQTNLVRQDALMFCLIDKNGQFGGRRGYYNVPNVTQNPVDKNGWMSGEPALYYGRAIASSNTLFICEGIKDVWAHTQGTSRIDLLARSLEIVSSTHGSAFPAEFRDPNFWKKYKHVLLGHDNDKDGEVIAKNVAQLAFETAGVRCRRVAVPQSIGKDWTDFWKLKPNPQEFLKLMTQSHFLPVEQIEQTDPK